MDLRSRRVFVGRIPRLMTDSNIKEVIEGSIGPLESVYRVFDSKNRKPQGFGYAVFKLETDARRALQKGIVYVKEWGCSLSFEVVQGRKTEKRSGENQDREEVLEYEKKVLPKAGSSDRQSRGQQQFKFERYEKALKHKRSKKSKASRAKQANWVEKAFESYPRAPCQQKSKKLPKNRDEKQGFQKNTNKLKSSLQPKSREPNVIGYQQSTSTDSGLLCFNSESPKTIEYVTEMHNQRQPFDFEYDIERGDIAKNESSLGWENQLNSFENLNKGQNIAIDQNPRESKGQGVRSHQRIEIDAQEPFGLFGDPKNRKKSKKIEFFVKNQNSVNAEENCFRPILINHYHPEMPNGLGVPNRPPQNEYYPTFGNRASERNRGISFHDRRRDNKRRETNDWGDLDWFTKPSKKTDFLSSIVFVQNEIFGAPEGNLKLGRAPEWRNEPLYHLNHSSKNIQLNLGVKLTQKCSRRF